jgi:hypothetical protein
MCSFSSARKTDRQNRTRGRLFPKQVRSKNGGGEGGI